MPAGSSASQSDASSPCTVAAPSRTSRATLQDHPRTAICVLSRTEISVRGPKPILNPPCPVARSNAPALSHRLKSWRRDLEPYRSRTGYTTPGQRRRPGLDDYQPQKYGGRRFVASSEQRKLDSEPERAAVVLHLICGPVACHRIAINNVLVHKILAFHQDSYVRSQRITHLRIQQRRIRLAPCGRRSIRHQHCFRVPALQDQCRVWVDVPREPRAACRP